MYCFRCLVESYQRGCGGIGIFNCLHHVVKSSDFVSLVSQEGVLNMDLKQLMTFQLTPAPSSLGIAGGYLSPRLLKSYDVNIL